MHSPALRSRHKSHIFEAAIFGRHLIEVVQFFEDLRELEKDVEDGVAWWLYSALPRYSLPLLFVEHSMTSCPRANDGLVSYQLVRCSGYVLTALYRESVNKRCAGPV